MVSQSSGLQENSLLNISGNFFIISGKLNRGTGNYQTRHMWYCPGVRVCQDRYIVNATSKG